MVLSVKERHVERQYLNVLEHEMVY